MNHGQHDELAALFAQNMQLSRPTAQQDGVVVEQLSQQQSWKHDESPIHYVSTHYTPTAHIRAESEPSRSPPPPYDGTAMPHAMAEVLMHNSIDPAALLPSQIALFHNADHEQRMRLLELWRISPPSYPLEDHMNRSWTQTTVQQEEAQARQRYEEKLQFQVPHHEERMLDTQIPITPIREAGETAWPPAARMRVASITASRPAARTEEAEPYMVDGYQKSTDPVYATVHLWQAPTHDQPQQRSAEEQMHHQYGMYQQIRNHADWERMNEQIARQHFGQDSTMDDDMVM